MGRRPIEMRSKQTKMMPLGPHPSAHLRHRPIHLQQRLRLEEEDDALNEERYKSVPEQVIKASRKNNALCTISGMFCFVTSTVSCARSKGSNSTSTPATPEIPPARARAYTPLRSFSSQYARGVATSIAKKFAPEPPCERMVFLTVSRAACVCTVGARITAAPARASSAATNERRWRFFERSAGVTEKAGR